MTRTNLSEKGHSSMKEPSVNQIDIHLKAPSQQAEVTTANAVTPSTVEWLWEGLFQMEKPLMMMSGDLRVGKSLIQIDEKDIAAWQMKT